MIGDMKRGTHPAGHHIDIRADEMPGHDTQTELSDTTEAPKDESAFWKGQFLYLSAELENTKKRLTRRAAEDVEAEKEGLLRDVLEVADGLDLALAHSSPTEENKSLFQGIELIQTIMTQFLAKYGVSEIDAWGKPFDPTIHEAIGVVPDPRVAPGTVLRVEQKGYRLDEKLLRPARVLVTPNT